MIDVHAVCAFFETSDSQFGFKKNSGCSRALYTLRCVTHYYISRGSTVNLCTLDVSKAFDKMSHHGLFIKLMERRIPNELLLLLENWFKTGVTCVKWGNVFSAFYKVSSGIRQGGVLSPYLFAIYTVNHKKGGSTFVTITLENLDRFLQFLHCCKEEEMFYSRMKKCPPRYLVKIKHNVSYFYNAVLTTSAASSMV